MASDYYKSQLEIIALQERIDELELDLELGLSRKELLAKANK